MKTTTMKTITKVLVGAALVLVLASCSDIALRGIIADKAAAGAATIRVGSVASSRTGDWWTLDDGQMMVDARAKLLNPANFGPSGTVKKTITITDTAATITTSLPSQFDVFFIGYISDGTFLPAELTAMTTWVSNGGVIIITADDSSHDDVATAFGYPTTINNYGVGFHTNYLVPYLAGLTHPIFVGPFGNITSATNVFFASSVGTFDLVTSPPGLATEQTVTWWTLGDVPYGSGKAILLTDVDLISNSDAQMSTGGSISLSYGNEVFLGNLFAYAHR